MATDNRVIAISAMTTLTCMLTACLRDITSPDDRDADDASCMPVATSQVGRRLFICDLADVKSTHGIGFCQTGFMFSRLTMEGVVL